MHFPKWQNYWPKIISKLDWPYVWKNHRLLRHWSNQISLLFHLLLTAWIYKLIWTPVFARWTPHLRCHLGSLSSVGWQNGKSEKCDVVETPTLDPWPSYVSVVYMTRIWTYFLPLKYWDWKSKQLQTQMFSTESPLFFCLRTIKRWGIILTYFWVFLVF